VRGDQMTGTDAVGLIPASAWVQAVFVCLFFVFVAYMLNWNAKQNKDSRAFQDGESEKWQSFISSLDKTWCDRNDKLRAENSTAMTEINQSIANLTKVTQKLVLQVEKMNDESERFYLRFDSRDLQTQEARNVAEESERGKTAERPVRSKRRVSAGVDAGIGS